ncbi:putative AC transposase [Fusarium oxysporum f. sp. raphani]|uniref:Putative AC transposase n=1 Tax=Fusarium oxysporum f. sp. raphani TaxID=96318 RepID=A0A8J5NR71_FUSOX|nr:putative AC transposase [Fusarium oxysporum f. sp. raphani]
MTHRRSYATSLPKFVAPVALLHVAAQNGGVLVRKTITSAIFETFELSPANKAVMTTQGRLVRQFPANATEIPSLDFEDETFLSVFTKTLEKMSYQTVQETVHKARKAEQEHDEDRETVEPWIVTDLLPSMLRGVGKQVTVPGICKNTREEVMWSNSKLPWRRSPVWFLIRVGLQLTMTRLARKDKDSYKEFMVFLMAQVLDVAVKQGAKSDILHTMSTKLSRRLSPPLPSPLTIMVPNSTSLTPSPVPTSSPTPTLSPAPVRYHEPPDEFIQDRITYVKRATITKKGFRLGSSHIWKYGLQYIRGSDKKEVYYCHECTAGKNKQELFVINGTSKVRNHLEQKHQIDPHSGIKKHSSTRKSVLDQQKSAAATNTFFWKDSMEKFKELLIRWIVYCHIAFFQLENRYFRELLFFLNPALLNHLPKAAKTIRSWVMDAFLSKKQRLREDLQRSRSRISISFDLWTSPNPYAILGVIAMWIDTTGKRRTTVLGIRRVYGEHTGENLGSVVLELLKEYDIGGDEIGYFMLDNASSNDTAVGFILKELCPWMDSKQRRHRRLRCLGHIVNLCCQAFLMGRNCEKYLAKLEKHYQRGDYAKVEELWKRFGCLGRLHNLVRYIRLTPQRREEFAAIIIGGDLSEFDGLELIQNNSTRWNSWFHSITRALNVRERLEIFSARHVPGKGSQGIANFKLDGQHWFELEKIELALKDFYAATLLSEAYYAAQILDPYRKWAWFRQEWVLHGDEEKRRWFDNAQSAVKHLWETEYKGRHPVEMLPPPARKERVPDPAFDRQREHKRIRTDAPVSTTDLYEQYISTDRLHDDEAGYDDAIAYWLSRYDSQRDLARFALDLFAISPMSDECERLFSSAKLTIVDRRGRLKADIIEACECLRAWYGKPQVEDDSDSEESAVCPTTKSSNLVGGGGAPYVAIWPMRSVLLGGNKH